MPYPPTSAQVAATRVQENVLTPNKALPSRAGDLRVVTTSTYLENRKINQSEPRPWAHLVAGG